MAELVARAGPSSPIGFNLFELPAGPSGPYIIEDPEALAGVQAARRELLEITVETIQAGNVPWRRCLGMFGVDEQSRVAIFQPELASGQKQQELHAWLLGYDVAGDQVVELVTQAFSPHTYDRDQRPEYKADGIPQTRFAIRRDDVVFSVLNSAGKVVELDGSVFEKMYQYEEQMVILGGLTAAVRLIPRTRRAAHAQRNITHYEVTSEESGDGVTGNVNLVAEPQPPS